MNRTIRLMMLIALMFTLCSCASGVPYTQLNPSITPESPDTGRIFFYRATALGAALQPKIVMNGEVVGKSIARGFFFKDVSPGKYEVVTSTEVKRKVSFVLDNGQTRYIRFNVSMGFLVGHVYGELVDPKEALPEIEKCKFVEENK